MDMTSKKLALVISQATGCPEAEAEQAWLNVQSKPRMLVHAADLIARPVRWLVPGFLEDFVISLIVGPRGSYKSFLLLDWAMRIATFQNLPVVVVSAEGAGLRHRINGWRLKFAPDRDLRSIPIYCIERRLNLYIREGTSADDVKKSQLAELRREIHELKIQPALICLDTYSKLSGGLDENSNTDAKRFIGQLDDGLRRTFDCSILIAVHTGLSDNGRPRGASALSADTDSEFIVHPERDAAGVVTRIVVTRERFKDSEPLPAAVYEREVVDLGYTHDDGKPASTLVLNFDADAKPAAARNTPRKLGPNVQLTLSAIKEHAPVGDIERERVVDLVAPTIKSNKRPRQAIERAVEWLLAEKLLHPTRPGYVSLKPVLSATAEEFA